MAMNHLIHSDTKSMTILPTAIIKLKFRTTEITSLNALCDTGSHRNIISRSIVDQYHLGVKPCHVKVFPFGSKTPNLIAEQVELQLLFTDRFEQPINISLLVVPQVTNSLPIQPFVRPDLPMEVKENLASDHFEWPHKVDVILGVEVWAQIIKNRIIKLNNGLLAHESKLGWLIYGSTMINDKVLPDDSLVGAVISHQFQDEEETLNNTIKRLWENDRVILDESKVMNPCERIFTETCYRNNAGRFVVQIPLKSESKSLGNSRNIALRRFYQLERRLQRDPKLRNQYNKFMLHYAKSGHMIQANGPPGEAVYYIPHHCVTEKFRVVFDASCKSDN